MPAPQSYGNSGYNSPMPTTQGVAQMSSIGINSTESNVIGMVNGSYRYNNQYGSTGSYPYKR